MVFTKGTLFTTMISINIVTPPIILPQPDSDTAQGGIDHHSLRATIAIDNINVDVSLSSPYFTVNTRACDIVVHLVAFA
jgi:hypothetical protein